MAPPTELHLAHRREGDPLTACYKQVKGEFYTAVTRPPSVYRGNPFLIEVGLAYGRGPEQAAAEPGETPAAPLAEGEEQQGRPRAGPRHPLRQPRAAALPAVGLRQRSRPSLETALAQLRPDPVPRRAAGRARW